MNHFKFEDYDGPICPDWWPRSLWHLHAKLPWHHGGPGSPVNYPPATNEILSALLIHTSSYFLTDEKAAKDIRASAVNTIIDMANKMDALHDEAMKARGKGNRP